MKIIEPFLTIIKTLLIIQDNNFLTVEIMKEDNNNNFSIEKIHKINLIKPPFLTHRIRLPKIMDILITMKNKIKRDSSHKINQLITLKIKVILGLIINKNPIQITLFFRTTNKHHNRRKIFSIKIHNQTPNHNPINHFSQIINNNHNPTTNKKVHSSTTLINKNNLFSITINKEIHFLDNLKTLINNKVITKDNFSIINNNLSSTIKSNFKIKCLQLKTYNINLKIINKYQWS